MRKLCGMFMIIASITFASLSLQYTNTAQVDNYSHQQDQINSYISTWIHSYHDSAKKLSFEIGNLNTTNDEHIKST
jgi:hypothetical protein